jgi:hypothetical protein
MQMAEEFVEGLHAAHADGIRALAKANVISQGAEAEQSVSDHDRRLGAARLGTPLESSPALKHATNQAPSGHAP